MTDRVNVSQTAPGAIIEAAANSTRLRRILSRSIGIEDKADIIADLEQALAQAG
jgi:O-acetylhomoserine/O-acetylserine sulfhydrylase-like pyridoxal-dependent enzyme